MRTCAGSIPINRPMRRSSPIGRARVESARASTRPVPQPSFPLHAVATLFLERQHLDRPRQQALTAKRPGRFVEDVGGVQIDSINVVERAHRLTLWSRFGPYDPA